MMEDWVNLSKGLFYAYVETFKDLTVEQHTNFNIKKEHSIRVAGNSAWLAQKLKLNDSDTKIAFLCGLFHDIGRFRQLVEFNTFNDLKSVDHADYAVELLKKEGFITKAGCSQEELVYVAIQWHNKPEISKKLTEKELFHAQLLRDADKLDILKVLTDYYSQRNAEANHTLTWELPKGTGVSEGVAKNVLAGKLVNKKDVASELDIKIMQLSWVYDLNFKCSLEYVLAERFLEKIYGSLPKNDRIIDIYRKIKVFAGNKMMEE